MAVQLMTVPYNSAGRPGGVAAGPAALRSAGLVEALSAHGEVVDAGDVPVPPGEPVRGRSGLLAEAALAGMVDAVRAGTAAALRAGRLPLLIGGDCPVLLGGLAGVREVYGQVGLLFVDGHEDAWPPDRSTTGEAADTELGLALGRHIDALPAALRELLPLVEPAAVTALGPRDEAELTAAGIESLARQITLVSPDRLHAEHRAGTLAAWTAAYGTRLGDAGRWWLHVDLDVLATDALPAVDYRQPGGLSWSELDVITAAALTSPGCAGWTVCIYNPDLDRDRGGARRIVRYLAAGVAAVEQGG